MKAVHTCPLGIVAKKISIFELLRNTDWSEQVVTLSYHFTTKYNQPMETKTLKVGTEEDCNNNKP